MPYLYRSFPQKIPIISGSFAENNLQLEASCGSAPPCIKLISENVYPRHSENVFHSLWVPSKVAWHGGGGERKRRREVTMMFTRSPRASERQDKGLAFSTLRLRCKSYNRWLRRKGYIMINGIGDHHWSSFWFSNKQHYLSMVHNDLYSPGKAGKPGKHTCLADLSRQEYDSRNLGRSVLWALRKVHECLEDFRITS